MTRENKKTHETPAASLPTYPSMQACAAATGIPKAVMQQAKKEGCPAFDSGNRVHLGKLLPWLFRKDAAGENEDWSNRLKRAQALTAEMELDELKRRLVDRTQVRADITAAASRAVAVMSQKFEIELPPKQDGMPAARIAEMNRAAIREVRTILSQPSAYAD